MTAIVDGLRRLLAPVSVILITGAIFLTFLVFFPSETRVVINGIGGIVAWLVGLVFGAWRVGLKFVLALFIVLALLTAGCALRAWLQVRWTNPETAWQCPGAARIMVSSSVAVLLAVLTELALTLFLLLSLTLVIGTVARVLLSDQWSAALDALGNILTSLVDSPRVSPEDLATLVDKIDANGATIMKVLAEPLRAGAAFAGGTVTAAASLLLFLFRRRKTNLDAARIVAVEIETTCRSSLQTVPQALVNAAALLDLPRGQLLLAIGSDRELLLLDPSAGHAAKLPACLLESVVEFFHADLALTQAYSAFGSVAFAKATRPRRERYLAGFTEIWQQTYQTAAFTALFRLALYLRLRAWAL